MVGEGHTSQLCYHVKHTHGKDKIRKINMRLHLLLTIIYIYSTFMWPLGSTSQGLLDSHGCSHSTPTHRGLGVQQIL